MKSQLFVQTFNFDKTPPFSRVFHPKFFWQFFSWNQSCQQLKSPKPQQFHEFFTQKIDNFFGKSKLNFWTKNEYFEQCVMQAENSFKNVVLAPKIQNIFFFFSALKNVCLDKFWSLNLLQKQLLKIVLYQTTKPTKHHPEFFPLRPFNNRICQIKTYVSWCCKLSMASCRICGRKSP